MSWAISAVIGPSLGGVLALYFPEYRQIFVLVGVVSMGAIIVYMLFTRGDHEMKSEEKVSGQTSKLVHEFPSTMRRLFSNKSVVAGCAAVFAHAFCHWMLPTFTPIYAAGVLGFNTARAHVQSPLMLVAIMATLGFCAVLEFPTSQAVVMELLPLADRGSATGVWGMMMSLGGTIGMFVIAGNVSVAPIEWIFYFCAAFSLAAGLGVVAIRGYFKAQP